MKRNMLRTLLGLMLINLLILSGCQKAEEEEKIQITLMHGWGGTLETHKLMQDIYTQFSVQNPDIELICIPYSDSSIAVEKANDMLAVGKMPDIISTNGLSYFVANAVKQGKALDIMPYIENGTILKSEMHPAVLSAWTTDSGKLYTIPDALEVAGYWYNKEYFRQAGIVDENGEPALPKTWEDFFHTAEKLDEWIKEKKPDISVVALDTVQIIDYLILARIAGSEEKGIELTKHSPSTLEDADIKKAIREIMTLYDYSKNANSIEDARQAFYEGKSVFYFNGVWESDFLADSKLEEEFAYGNYPTESGESLSYVSPSSGYVICKNENQKKNDASIRFLNYILSEKVQTKLALETGQAPSNPNINKEELMMQYPLLGNAINTAYEADIQIKTINSVWSEDKLKALQKEINNQ